MNHEQQPRGKEPRPAAPDQGQPGGIWDPNGRVGDVYQVEIGGKAPQRPQIWVGSLSDYNNGILHGEWIDAAREDGEVWADVEAMLARSPTMATTGEPAEEWGIFDYEDFGPARVYQHDDLAAVGQLARGIAEHGLAFAAWADVMEGNEEAAEQFEEAYLGHYDTLQAYVEQLVDDLGYDELLDRAVSEQLRPYVQIDVEGLARDIQLAGDVHAVPAEKGGVWLFDGRI